MKKKEIKKKRKFDEVFAILLVALVIIIVSIYVKKPALEDAQQITEIIINNKEVSFANNGVIDEAKLQTLKGMNYEQIKNELQIKNEFCMYIEDEIGNLILAKGSEKLIQDGIHCKE